MFFFLCSAGTFLCNMMGIKAQISPVTQWPDSQTLYDVHTNKQTSGQSGWRREGPDRNKLDINLLLTECEGRPRAYWPIVVTVQTDHSGVHTKITEGQYPPVELKQAGWMSSLLYGTWALTFRIFESKKYTAYDLISMVHNAKSRPRKNQSEHSKLPQGYLSCHIIFFIIITALTTCLSADNFSINHSCKCMSFLFHFY